ncbi:Imm8 family immunity protein [Acinetobacter sp. ANC 4648]|uniref:Imm8 family immunity protein n=1 Tax=Acinetobacter sp. ANC 4648 TaxID=1977875 RepID=UPI00148A9187|nr:Imm8 family immunity protein [Acinetobacter sp. ANC 4648]
MRAQLKSIECFDVDLTTYSGEEDGSIGLELTLYIGEFSSKEAEVFNVFVCSSDWLEKYENKPRLILNTILVSKFDLKEIENLINNYLMHCSGNTWEEMAYKISKAFSWGFDNYQELKNP